MTPAFKAPLSDLEQKAQQNSGLGGMCIFRRLERQMGWQFPLISTSSEAGT